MSNFRKAEVLYFRELDNKTLEDQGEMQSCQIFKKAFLGAQELSIPMYSKLGKEGKRPDWLNRDLLVRLEGTKKMHRQWKQGEVSWEEHRVAAKLCMDKARKTKVHLELDLVRASKKNKKGFDRYINKKRKVQKGVLSLVRNTVSTVDKEKTEIFNLFASVFTSDCSSHT